MGRSQYSVGKELVERGRTRDVVGMKMKTIWVAALFVWGISGAAIAERPKLIVAILIDQLRYDYLERFSDQFGEGGFRLLTERGAFMTSANYEYGPTTTGPGHASFLSGATPDAHGVIGNEWFDRQTGKFVYCVGDPSAQGVGTLTTAGRMSPRNFIGTNFADQLRLHFQSKVVGISMKDRGAILPAGKKPAGAYWFESASGNFVTSSYYKPELPGWVEAFNQRKRASEFIGAKWERLLDPKLYTGEDAAAGEGTLSGEKTSTFPHAIISRMGEGFESIMPTPFGNQLLLEFAKAAIDGENLGQGTQPDLLCVSFSSIDYCGHRFGPYSHEIQDITLRMDRQLADLLGYLDKKFGLANIALVLTADHGVAPTPEYAAAQGLDAERVDADALLIGLRAKLTERFGPGKFILNPRLSDGMLYLDHAVLKEHGITAESVTDYIREWAFETGKFQACYSRAQLLEGKAPGVVGQRIIKGYNSERGADAVLIFKPFYIPERSLVGLDILPAGTNHGSPYSYDTHVPVLFYGAAFNQGRYADEFCISDIVPTLCAALKMDVPSGCAGKPFSKVLASPGKPVRRSR